jgi:hypothetical protein
MFFGFHGFFKDSEFTEFSQVSPISKLLLCREKTMDKMDKVFIDKPKMFLVQQSTDNVKKHKKMK